jgi:hypothetical protein
MLNPGWTNISNQDNLDSPSYNRNLLNNFGDGRSAGWGLFDRTVFQEDAYPDRSHQTNLEDMKHQS